MIVVLPPSETKNDGGDGAPLDVRTLVMPRLASRRRVVVRAVRTLAADVDSAVAALKLGRTQHAEVARNRAVARSATMAAIDRYTGVLYEGLRAETLTDDERAFAHDHVLIQSALLGPVAALDLIPAYRLSHDSRLPELSLRTHWNAAVSREFAALPGLLLDLRSEGYVALGAAPDRADSVYLRVLTVDTEGRRRALNHFNKKAKGEFTRWIITSRVDVDTVSELTERAASDGWRLEPVPGRPRELALLV
ncbi:peroxide stress protein YaaA [Glaciibacter flavus]|uniref:Peroxide stress protein YaaA n=1 Tax=Orlajensenia flava TaxID=2565934 RepID=A0A4S4FYS6_9MICO|nr:peroxide stress protein YaaA [Glaciibacter flavus]THG35608.1 peroxide stress protein YaaA [Glaciibacter flavus]